MNRWLLIRRARGPAYLILFGITALLNQFGILGFGRSWPLYLILAGLLMLAERAALVSAPAPPFSGSASIAAISALMPRNSSAGAEGGPANGKWSA